MMIIKRRIVCLNELNRRIGEDHHRAKLSNHDVELIRELRATYGLTYQVIADKFEVSKITVLKICCYKIRAQIPMAYRTIRIVE